MFTTGRNLVLAAVAVGLVIVVAPVHGQDGPGQGTWENPVIKGYGAAWPFPQAAFQPEKGHTYKVTVSVGHLEKGDQPPAGLIHAAAVYNIFGSSGFDTAKNLKMVVIIHSGATPASMNDAAYREKYGVANPNVELITRLKAAGAEVYQCGQSMRRAGFDKEQLLPEVDLAVSALAVLISTQDAGYALLPF